MRNTRPRGCLGLPAIGAVLALSAIGFLIGRAPDASAAPAPPQAHATSQSVNLALASGALTLEVSANGGTKADNDGTGSVFPVTNTPAVALLSGQSLIGAGVLSETAEADIDGSSYACTGVLSPGGAVHIGSQGETCTATGNGTGGVQINLNQIPGVGGALSGIASLSLQADAVIAHAHEVAPGTAAGNATITNLKVNVNLLSGLLPPLSVPVNISTAPNAEVLPAVIDALTAQVPILGPVLGPLLNPLISALANDISPIVSIKSNYQSTQNGVLTVSGLHISLLNNAAATADVAKVTVGPNLAPTECNPFLDVDDTNPFCQDINWLKIGGITQGDDGGTLYKPTTAQTRQAMAAFMYRYYNPGDADRSCTQPYPWPDVNATQEHCGSIIWMKESHLANGYSDGTYRPGANVSRQAVAAFLYRATHNGAPDPGCSTKPYPDVALDNEFCGAISWFKEQGIASGYEDGTFKPTNPVTRQAMAAWVHKYSTMYARPQI